MNITEKAKEYAKGKALEAITSAIEQAYVDGYNDGMQFLDISLKEDIETSETDVVYVDLGLPSGTRWSSDYLMDNSDYNMLTYVEASRKNIPTVEQYEELCNECLVTSNDDGIEFRGINGNSIIIRYITIEMTTCYQKTFGFWLKDDGEGNYKYCACNIYNSFNPSDANKENMFMGLRIPVMLVCKYA